MGPTIMTIIETLDINVIPYDEDWVKLINKLFIYCIKLLLDFTVLILYINIKC